MQLAEAPADLDVRLVHADREALVQVPLGLFADRGDDGLGGMTAIHAADTAHEVDVLASLDIDDRGTVRALDEEPARGHPCSDVALARLAQSRGLRAGPGSTAMLAPGVGR